MANFRRRRPRTSTRSRYSTRSWPTDWLGCWPRWWDVVFHTRPKRRKERATIGRIMRGEIDADQAVWPLGNHKPHNYYW